MCVFSGHGPLLCSTVGEGEHLEWGGKISPLYVRSMAKAAPRSKRRHRRRTGRRRATTKKHRGGNSYPLTCVSAYFDVKNKVVSRFADWFPNTLSIHCPYVFFGNKDIIEMIKEHRKDLPTHYIEYDLDQFITNKWKHNMAIDEFHCPSIELSMVWNEKMYMLKRAAEINPYGSEWFQWVDAGISIYRAEMPPRTEYPNRDKLLTLPKDKFIFSSSFNYSDETPIHTIPHHIAGTTYILHKDLIPKFVDIYTKKMDELHAEPGMWTDQIVLTRIYRDAPELFHKLTDGYGEVMRHLY
jgi:hypothetical protein